MARTQPKGAAAPDSCEPLPAEGGSYTLQPGGQYTRAGQEAQQGAGLLPAQPPAAPTQE